MCVCVCVCVCVMVCIHIMHISVQCVRVCGLRVRTGRSNTGYASATRIVVLKKCTSAACVYDVSVLVRQGPLVTSYKN